MTKLILIVSIIWGVAITLYALAAYLEVKAEYRRNQNNTEINIKDIAINPCTSQGLAPLPEDLLCDSMSAHSAKVDNTKYTILNNVMYRDSEKYGDIIDYVGDEIRIRIDNNNRFSKGQIVTMSIKNMTKKQ